MATKILAHYSPGRTIVMSILLTIVVGTLLLALPIARTAEISLLDLFFTATSSTCVTGLFTVSLDQFTTFGQFIILCLVQIGGLGLITMTLFFMSLFVNLGLTTQLMAGQLLEIDALHLMKKIIIFIISVTLLTELIGASIIFVAIYQDYPLFEACFYALFHAVSSFCNAGISIFPGHDLASFNNNLLMLYTTMGLVFCGGLGFITWRELFLNLMYWARGKRVVHSLQTKLIIIGTSVFILFLTALFWILEHDRAFAGMSSWVAFSNALFNGVVMRSAGFLTVSLDQFQMASILLMMVASVIGCAPGSTGSGIKITTFILLIATIKASLESKQAVEIKGRQIARDQLHKAITIIALSVFWMILSLFLLLITEEHLRFIELALESVTAFTNLGVSTGVTPLLSNIGKFFIMSSMFIGRIGSITLILALRKSKKEAVEYSYPEERVMLG